MQIFMLGENYQFFEGIYGMSDLLISIGLIIRY
jgi:hypothetical protein